MPRWEPDAPLRLMHAALELFLEQGYDRVTVAQIAERAGLVKSSFFRHFPDKREVLFYGQDQLRDLITQAIAAAPKTAGPIHAVAAGIAAAEPGFGPERRQFAAQRQNVIAAHPELQEREALKQLALADAISTALQARHTPATIADLASQIGIMAFRTAFTNWVTAAQPRPFSELTHDALASVRAASTILYPDKIADPPTKPQPPGRRAQQPAGSRASEQA